MSSFNRRRLYLGLTVFLIIVILALTPSFVQRGLELFHLDFYEGLPEVFWEIGLKLWLLNLANLCLLGFLAFVNFKTYRSSPMA